MVKNSKGYQQGFVTNVYGMTCEEIPIIKSRVEGDAWVFLSSVVSANCIVRFAQRE